MCLCVSCVLVEGGVSFSPKTSSHHGKLSMNQNISKYVCKHACVCMCVSEREREKERVRESELGVYTVCRQMAGPCVCAVLLTRISVSE